MSARQQENNAWGRMAINQCPNDRHKLEDERLTARAGRSAPGNKNTVLGRIQAQGREEVQKRLARAQ